MKKYIKEIIILIIFIVLILAKSNYLYFSDEYYIDDLIYSKNDNKPLNGFIYSDKFGYTTSYINVKDGYISGDYVYEIDGTVYKHDFFINDTKTFSKVRKIVAKEKIAISYEQSTKTTHINIRIINNHKFHLQNNYLQNHKQMAIKLYDIFKNKKNIGTIEFIYVNKLYLYNEEDILRFSFESNNIEFCVHNYNKYNFVGDSTVYVP